MVKLLHVCQVAKEHGQFGKKNMAKPEKSGECDGVGYEIQRAGLIRTKEGIFFCSSLSNVGSWTCTHEILTFN